MQFSSFQRRMTVLSIRPVHDEPPYSFSFLAGALFVKESVALAEILNRHGAWDQAVAEAVQQNALRQRNATSATRILREVRYRLQQFSAAELDYFVGAGARDQRYLLFIAVCLRFRFIREFIDEVARPKLDALERQLYPADFTRFFDRKGAQAEEVEALTDKSRAKVKQVLVRMLAESALIDSTRSQKLQAVFPTAELARLVGQTDPGRLRFLLLPDVGVRQYTS